MLGMVGFVGSMKATRPSITGMDSISQLWLRWPLLNDRI